MNLRFNSVDPAATVVAPEDFDELSPTSAATLVFTDFSQHHPQIIDATTRAIEADYSMRHEHLQFRLVVDAKMHVVGVVSSDDLRGESVMRKVAQGYDRNDLTVGDLMQPVASMRAIDYPQLLDATVEDVLDGLTDNGTGYCLVLDPSRGHIRGVLSVPDITRRLHIPLQVKRRPTFVDMVRAVNQPAY